jgi:hypothetical protein
MKMSRKGFGRCAGVLATVAVLLFWVVLELPNRLQPAIGGGSVLGLVAGSVALSILAVCLDSKWWFAVVGVSVFTFVLIWLAEGV